MNSQNSIASNNYARQTHSAMDTSASGSTLGVGGNTVAANTTTSIHQQDQSALLHNKTIHSSTQYVKDQLVVEQTNETVREAPIVHEKHIFHSRPVLQERHIYKEVPVVERTVVHEQPSLTTRDVIHELPVTIQQNEIIKEAQPVKHEIQRVQHEERVIQDTNVKVIEKDIKLTKEPIVRDTVKTTTTDTLMTDNSKANTVLGTNDRNIVSGTTSTGNPQLDASRMKLENEKLNLSDSELRRKELSKEHHEAVKKTESLRAHDGSVGNFPLPGGLQMHNAGTTLDASQTGAPKKF